MLVWLKPHLALAVLLLIFAVLGFTFTLTFPFTTGPDEVAHFQFARFIARYSRLPLIESERIEGGYKSDWPPLFHLVVGLSGKWINMDAPPFVKLTENNPRLQLVVGIDDVLGSRAITTEDPYRSEVLLWYWGRWWTLLGGLIGVAVVYFLVQAIYPGNPWLALATASVLAFIPTYLHVSGALSYDPWLGAVLALYFLFLFYTLRAPQRHWPYLVLGLLLGAAALVKYTPLPALSLPPLLVGWLAYRQKWPMQATVWRLTLLLAGLTLTLGSWLLYMELYFNQVAKAGWVYGLLSPFLVSDGSDETSLRIAGFISQGNLGIANPSHRHDSFFTWAWHLFDGVWGGGWLTWLFLGLWIIALAGWLFSFKVRPKLEPDHPAPALWFILLAAHVTFFAALPLARFLFTRDVVTGMGQHILFPSGAALLLLLLRGLLTWLPPRSLTLLFFGLAGVGLGQSSLALANPTHPWPLQTVPLAHEETLATFETTSLIGYDYHPSVQTLDVILQWRAEALAAEDYRLELTLLDTAGQAQVRWLGQPLNGRYPTRAWQPGDRLRDVIHLPIAGLPPDTYRVHLRWLGESGPVSPASVTMVSLRPAAGQPNSVDLGPVALTPSPISPGQNLQLNGQTISYTLWSPSWPLQPSPVYRENATITFSVQPSQGNKLHLSLVGPNEQPYAPFDRTGAVYNFIVEPTFASGDYRLRVEQGAAQAESGPLLRIETEKRQFQVKLLAQPLAANFAGQIALLGYDLPERRVQPGGSLLVTLEWQALKTIGADLIMFNHLVNEKQEIWGGRDRRAHEVYSTMLWASGEVVEDPFEVQVKADAPAGIYSLLVGVYLPVGKSSVSLPLLVNGQISDLTNINLGLVKVGRTPPDFVSPAAQPQNLFHQPFGAGPNITLLGYDLGKDNCQQSTVNCQLSITFYWRSESPLAVDYTTFVHVRNAAGETVAQKDQPPLNGAYPTSLWDPGEIIADEIAIPLPADLAAGSYQLVLGLYDFNTGQRLAIPGQPANEVKLTDVAIR